MNLFLLARALSLSLCIAGSIGIRLEFEPASLDWNRGDVPIHVINNVVEGLYKIGARGELLANEAKDFPKRQPDGSWRITLRSNLTWSDKVPIRAQDYVDSWTRLLDPKTASTYAYLLFDLASAREFNSGKEPRWIGAHAISATEIEIRLQDHTSKKFPANVFTHWATFPIRSNLIAKYGENWAAKPQNMAFNGPYKITTYEHEAKIELVPNPEHRKPGLLSKIEALIVQDEATALRLYESGRLHFAANLNSIDRNLLATRSDFHQAKSPVLVYLGFDFNDATMGQAENRKALSLAIDRSSIPKILGPGFTPISIFSPEMNLSRPSAVKLARKTSRKSPQMKFSFGYYQKPINRLLAEYLHETWKTNLNLDANLQEMEIKSYWTRLARKPFQVFLNSYSPPAWDKNFYFKLLHSTNPMNLGRWKNKQYDTAVENNDLKFASKIFEEQLPIAPLYFRPYEYLMSPKLKDAVLNPMTTLDLQNAQIAP